MLVLPGPGLVFLGIGFAILAIEFTWAEVVLHRATHHGKKLLLRARVHARIIRIRLSNKKTKERQNGARDA